MGVELFAGCGGLSTGALDAGLAVVAGFEAERRAVVAYDHNHRHRGSVGVRSDLLATTPDAIRAASGLMFPDFVVGGPPCQPFSRGGKGGGMSDPRSSCMPAFAALAVALSPRLVVMENVPDVLRHGALRTVEEVLAAAGYRTAHAVLEASAYGVPQVRRRLFLVAMRDVVAVSFPEPTHGPGKPRPAMTASEALDDLPDAGFYGECGVPNHEPTVHSPEMVATLRALAPGQRHPSLRVARLRGDRPSFAMRAGAGNFTPCRPCHHARDRVITVREAARLHGFGDDFEWPDSVPRLQQYRQVGNAVPPALAKAVIAHAAREAGLPVDPASLRGDHGARPHAFKQSDDERRAAIAARSRQ